MGGDYRVSTAYLSRGEGAVRDIDGQSYDNPPVRHQESYHYYYPRTVQWYTLGDGIENIDNIKQAIIDYGVMATCMCYSNAFINSNYTHYQPMSNNTDPNHSVAIIGWDDNKQTQAEQPGAWLCKNSWGSWWGENGYFWISYYDKHACRNPEMGAVSFQDVEPMQYEKVFYHDYHGWRDQLENVSVAANRFDIEGDYFLNGVNFFVNADFTNYTATIFETMGDNGPENEIASVSGTTDHIGFYTADFDAPVSLVGMSEFVIQLELSEGGMPYDRTSDIPVLLGGSQRTIVESVAHENESFYYNPESASWTDFYNYDDPSGFSQTGNFCIKGLATSTTVGINDYQFKNINIYPNPADSYTNIVFNNNSNEKATIVVRNITGSIVYTQSIALSAGENNLKINTNNIKAGVYSLEITDDENILGKEKIIIR